MTKIYRKPAHSPKLIILDNIDWVSAMYVHAHIHTKLAPNNKLEITPVILVHEVFHLTLPMEY